jgi:myo-inositol 2-dehydrogenase/D-chiro-inositol 1-dehydrogenase
MEDPKMKNKQIDRRNFVKGTAAATGAMMVAGMPLSSSAFSRPEAKKLKLALVGCGGRGTGAAVQALTADPDVQLVAMADAFGDRLENSLKSIMNSDHLAEDRKKNVKVKDGNKYVGFDGYKDAIREADVVILAAPPGFRPYHLEECINQNKHVFCEKPLGTDAVGIRKVLDLVKISEEKKLSIVVGLQRHYQTNYREVMKRVKDGAIGDIVSGQVYWNGGGVWVRERKPEYTEMQYQMRNWYYFNWLCGDHIVEQHIHNIDVFNWAKGAYPVSAQGMGGRQVRTGKEHGEIFDHHFVEFKYEDGTMLNSQCRHIKGCMNKVSETIVGTKGTFQTDGSGRGIISDLKGGNIYRHRGKDDPNPYQVEHDELFAAIRSGEAINDLHFGAMSTMTAILGRYATYSGVEVTMEDALASNVQLMPATNSWDDAPPVLPNSDGYYPIAVPGKSMVF